MKLFIYLLNLYIELKILINKPVKLIEAQLGSILKETDIVRYEDIYGRVK